MEPRGCNRWQSVANRTGAEAARTSQNRCRRLRAAAVWIPCNEVVDGSSPSEGSLKNHKWPFWLPQRRTPIARLSLNVSPRPVPKISGALEFWLEQRRLTSSSTSPGRERCRVIRYREATNRFVVRTATPEPEYVAALTSAITPLAPRPRNTANTSRTVGARTRAPHRDIAHACDARTAGPPRRSHRSTRRPLPPVADAGSHLPLPNLDA
jgi:hypothetical protein